MKVKSIKRYNKPSYPDKECILKDKELLNMKPKRWLGKANMSVALSTVIILMSTACSEKVAGSDPEGIKKILTAPIFEHGNGRGGYGCVSVAPPAFLSEAEALQVIQEEVEREGLKLEKNIEKIDGLKMPVPNLNPEYNEEGNLKKPTKTKNGILKLDSFDNKKNIGVEFVSKEDVLEWGGNTVNSTYETYDMLDTAKVLQKSLNNEVIPMTIGVFYDPISYFTKKGFSEEADKIMKNNQDKWENIEKEFKELSKRDLREQVKDFLSWLKAEGII